LRASYTTFTETRSPLQNSFTPAVVGSTADMASPRGSNPQPIAQLLSVSRILFIAKDTKRSSIMQSFNKTSV
jgi:hypothetical protein